MVDLPGTRSTGANRLAMELTSPPQVDSGCPSPTGEPCTKLAATKQALVKILAVLMFMCSCLAVGFQKLEDRYGNLMIKYRRNGKYRLL